MAENAERGVVFVLRTQVDPAAKAMLDQFAQEIQSKQAMIDSAITASAAATAASITQNQSAVQATTAAVVAATQDAVDYEKTSAEEIVKSWSDAGAAKANASKAAVDRVIDDGQKVSEAESKSAEEIVKSWTAAYTQVSEAGVKSQTSISDRLGELDANRLEAERAFFEKSAKLQSDSIQQSEQLRTVESMSLEELLAERESLARAGYTRERENFDKALEEERQAMERYLAAVAELRQKALTDSESVTDEEILLVHELEQEAVRSVENREKSEAKFRAAESKERARSVNEAIAGMEEHNDRHERMAEEARRRNEQISTSAGRIVSAISEGSEAVMRLARGFGHLGLVGEKDLQKLTDSLLWIQGSTEIFTGLVRSIKQVSEGYEAYRKMVVLTTEAQLALNAATAAGAAIQGAAGAAGAVAGATGGARAAAGAVGDIAGGVAGGVAGGASTSIMARLALGATAAGGSIAGVGAAVGFEAGASSIALFSAALAAAAGGLAGLTSVVLTTREAMKFGVGEGAAKGGIVEKIGTNKFNPFFQLMMLDDENGKKSETGQAYADAEAAEKKLGIAQKQRQLNLELEKRDQAEINRIKSEQASLSSQQAATDREMQAARMALLTPEQRRTELIKQLSEVEKNATLTAEDRGRRIIDLSRQRLHAEQEIHRTQLQAAQDAEREDQRKLADINQRIEAERNSMLSAQERFGLMTKEEQQGVLDISQRFRQGAGNVESEDLRKIRGFSGVMDEQISAEARRRAQAAGFGQVQAPDVQRLQGLERQRATIEANIKADATVIAKLEVDSRKVADQINQQIDGQFKIIMQAMAEKIGKMAIDAEKLEAAMLQRFARL